MKSAIHPTFYYDARVVCACGNTFTIGSTKQTITVEVCSKCHPLYTGEHRYIDTRGKVDEFQRKQKIAAEYQQKKPLLKAKKNQPQEKKVKTLKELLIGE